MPRVLWGSKEVGRFIMAVVPLYEPGPTVGLGGLAVSLERGTPVVWSTYIGGQGGQDQL
jgi:hypothetical protein